MNEVTFSHEETFESPCVKGWDKGILGTGNRKHKIPEMAKNSVLSTAQEQWSRRREKDVSRKVCSFYAGP